MITEILVVALIATNAFWMWQIQKLTNKLMSRNYGEYVTSDKFQTPKETQKSVQEIQDEFNADLAELNRLG